MSEMRVMLLGVGGHGCVVLDAFLLAGGHVAGILDPGKAVGSRHFDVAVLGGDEWLDGREPGSIVLVNGVGASPATGLRRDVFNVWKRRGFDFARVQHPSAVVGREVEHSEGSQIMAGAVVQCRSVIGANAVINTRASVDHGCRIGVHAFIGPGAILCGDVRVGDGAFLGAGAVVLPGVTVGHGAIVGAGSVITRDVSPGGCVVGVPAVTKTIRLL